MEQLESQPNLYLTRQTDGDGLVTLFRSVFVCSPITASIRRQELFTRHTHMVRSDEYLLALIQNDRIAYALICYTMDIVYDLFLLLTVVDGTQWIRK